ncbi:hypothetical protein [Deinococcus soli (ex Cha et al. 2016)]|uniref:Uncharacterized protein n=2 Tax=Deinococcus soli (ex Cha et al. 2016) TaxID=1309411 RepID=A0ACC6KGN4_9DEIO|nr:hypothetical protein [Deinococcus soli (ex Cha et al. 2016)]MDR6218195.1 hypothetical protein [Deinococcus soli (ex Cha et al. 2016)]MDR6328935.1 hypothetical protein [Deinococcus soli (ex Cha et al. 2016)]MDR6751577.1 hypothetical protein [Deinococcus soli (ex Cha et al. 2016)]
MPADAVTAHALSCALSTCAPHPLPLGTLTALLSAALVSAAGLHAALRLPLTSQSGALRRRERAGVALVSLSAGTLLFGVLTGSATAFLTGVAGAVLSGALLRGVYPDVADEDDEQLW